MLHRAMQSQSRGSALLIVLAILGLIAALISVVAHSVGEAALASRLGQREIRNEADLRSAIELAALTVKKSGKEMRSAEAVYKFPDRTMRVSVVNESARVDLNFTDAKTLSALFQALGLGSSDAESAVASVIEWRGGSASQKFAPVRQQDDIFTQTIGTGDGKSQDTSAAPKSMAGTRLFLYPGQLVNVPGLSLAQVKSVLPYVTVASGSNRIDPFIASEPVLNALSSRGQTGADAFIRSRSSNTSRETAIMMLGIDKEKVSDGAALGWLVQAEVVRAGGERWRGEAVIIVPEEGDESYRVLYVEPNP